MIHCASAAEACRLCWMAGSATLTIVASRNAMPEPSTAAASVHRAVGEPRHGRYDLWVRSSTPSEELAPAVELAKRYCWVTNTLATAPEITYHLGEGIG